MVLTRSQESYLPFFVPKGSATVSLWGPFIRIGDATRPGTQGNLEIAKYKIGRGTDSNGWIAVVDPVPILAPDGAWLEFACRVWLRPDATFTGSVTATGKHHAIFMKPTPP